MDIGDITFVNICRVPKGRHGILKFVSKNSFAFIVCMLALKAFVEIVYPLYIQSYSHHLRARIHIRSTLAVVAALIWLSCGVNYIHVYGIYVYLCTVYPANISTVKVLLALCNLAFNAFI